MAATTLTYTDARGTKREQYQRTRAALGVERTSFEDHWRELARFTRPRRTRFQVTDRNKGDRRNQQIIDSTGSFALRTLQSGLHAGVTSPARPWFRLTVADSDLAEFGRVKEWLHHVTQRMQTVFLRSNLYQSLPVVYGDMGCFATSAMAVLEDPRELIRTYPYPIGSFWLGVSSRGIVDTFIREYQMTVRQAVRDFAWDPETNQIDWSRFSTAVKQAWDRGDYEAALGVCWIVEPNPDADPNKLDAKYLPWTSCWFERDAQDDRYLRESGFNEFPILAPRWDVLAEDSYGTDCPGMTALGDVKALQLMQKRKAQAVEKMINPPVQAPTQVLNQKVSLLPGDVSFADDSQYGKGIRPIHEVSMAVGDITVDIQDTRQLIRNAFYEPLFLMLAQTERREITAREVEERHEEKLLALGPVLERMNDELLDPLIDRTYAIMERAGQIPPPPEELEGQDLKVEYLSLMSQAQKLVSVVSMDRFVESVLPIAEAFPEARFKLDPMQAVDEYGDAYGVNPKLIVPDEVARANLDRVNQAAAMQRQAEVAATAAKAGRDLAATDMEKDTALRRIVEGAGG